MEVTISAAHFGHRTTGPTAPVARKRLNVTCVAATTATAWTLLMPKKEPRTAVGILLCLPKGLLRLLWNARFVMRIFAIFTFTGACDDVLGRLLLLARRALGDSMSAL